MVSYIPNVKLLPAVHKKKLISQGIHALGIKELGKRDPFKDFLPNDVNFIGPKNYTETSVKRNYIKYFL